MTKKSHDGFFWTLFSGGGVVAAFLIPIHIFLFGLAIPLGWLPAASYEHLSALVHLPIVKIYLFILCSLPLFHWAHRFRYTLEHGLRLDQFSALIILACYGGAVVGSAASAYILLRV